MLPESTSFPVAASSPSTSLFDGTTTVQPRRHASLSFTSNKPLYRPLLSNSTSTPEQDTARQDGRPNPNINGFSAALSCYPIVRQLASQLDLNTLHNLSRTCRQFRANLLEYRDQLIRHTLHCDLETAELKTDHTLRVRDVYSRQHTTGKVGQCARDMVGECQRCASVVCRNCTIKPPPTPVVRVRHRRLCRACTKAPLHLITAPQRPRAATSATPSPPSTPNCQPKFFEDHSSRAFTASAFQRAPCRCAEVVWLCQPCGQHLRNADTMYVRAWSWRTRYSHYLGGVGTGAGQGNEGVECGRGPSCLAARIVEHEIECDAETLASLEGSSPDRWTGTSYLAQEIEGVGGGFKMKHKKQVLVGDVVKIYKDEEDKTMQFLEREVAGKVRSWCSWCERVILGEKDLAEASGRRPSSSSSCSASSCSSV
ncbi:hypothetical protein BU24DRAFT_398750 [Aaosphaeria arxii CBS 175.79]|uniref:F-box domain-containing protein n=1 Tax=Aaosphaeria arxii CBS 175.79 TaxID=1450172 RepID=A0A6A5XDB3_9PLEO|nr:uncharacterized protein BU24DRAFT_398750 [Aaosphaeria arxii CBS 175.79]KAF2010754.1 hypothetical protein BU24DRAFT_398750 [Aaosphaeria arxii CBS 175.79]